VGDQQSWELLLSGGSAELGSWRILQSVESAELGVTTEWVSAELGVTTEWGISRAGGYY
ncbi:unnamed protein product, partial [Staurois parvus]